MSTPHAVRYPTLSESLRNVYLLQVRLDLADHRMEVVQAKPALRTLIEAAPDAAGSVWALAEAFVPEESREECERFSDLSTLPQRLLTAPEGYLTFVFHALDGRFLLATVLPETTHPDGSLATVLVLVRDATPQVTERRTAQENLVHAYEQLEESVNILHSLQNIYFTGFYVDILTDRYKTLFVAPWLTQATPQEGRFSTLVSSYVENYTVPDDHLELYSKISPDYIRSALRRENLSLVRQSFSVDYRSIRFGQQRWCRISVIMVDLDESDCARHVLAVLEDITEYKNRELEQQRQLEAAAREAQQANAAKTEFLHRISHDIRTPINGIQGMLRIADYYPNDFARQKQCRDKIRSASGYLLDLVNDVLNMSKLESGTFTMELQPFNMPELLNQINSIAEAQAVEKGIRYTLGNNRHTWLHQDLIGSPLYLRQILLNLAGNAVKYNKPGSWIRVECRELSATDTTALYEFVCADGGLGMSKEFQKKMFEPFTQERQDARTSYSGTGLGLAITKGLVEKMGGTITVQSQKGKGSTFTVTIPLTISHAAHPAAAAQKDIPAGSLRGVRVLLVEDNDLNAEVAQFLLEQEGMQVELARNGQQALKAFEAHAPGELDAILMDIMMPVMDGYAATRAIRLLPRPDAKSIPILAMTANAFEDDIAAARVAGMNAHLAKPLEPQKLEAALLAALQNNHGRTPPTHETNT